MNSSSSNRVFLSVVVVINIVILKEAFIETHYWHLVLFITLPLLVTAVIYNKQKANKGLQHQGPDDNAQSKKVHDGVTNFYGNASIVPSEKSLEDLN